MFVLEQKQVQRTKYEQRNVVCSRYDQAPRIELIADVGVNVNVDVDGQVEVG